MEDDESPPAMLEHPWTKGDLINVALGQIFPEWSSTRISRWLGVNPRTVQRWLRSGRGEFADEVVPSDVQAKILGEARHIENIGLGEQLDRWIEMQLIKNMVDKEILAAHLAHRYKKLMGRDID